MVNIEFQKLIYSCLKNDLSMVEINPKGYTPPGFTVITEQIDRKDGNEFIRRMRNKYVRGRKRGRFPAIDIIRLELELFMKLKDYRRKLV